VRIIQVSQVGQMLRTILFGELNFASALTLIAEASVDILQRTRSRLKWSAGGFREAFTVETDSLQTRAKSGIGIGPILVITLVVWTRLLKKSRIEKSGESEAVSNGQTKARILS
jgi:hypothetical protein